MILTLQTDGSLHLWSDDSDAELAGIQLALHENAPDLGERFDETPFDDSLEFDVAPEDVERFLEALENDSLGQFYGEVASAREQLKNQA